MSAAADFAARVFSVPRSVIEGWVEMEWRWTRRLREGDVGAVIASELMGALTGLGVKPTNALMEAEDTLMGPVWLTVTVTGLPPSSWGLLEDAVLQQCTAHLGSLL